MDTINKQTTININQKANMIWNVADVITGLYKPHEYGKVILPLAVLKRFNDVLLPTKDDVLSQFEKVKSFEVQAPFLEKASGYQFYNTSKFMFNTLVNDADNIEDNFRSYINGFSENVVDVLDNFEFDKEITKLAKANKLFYVIQEFNKNDAYMGDLSSVDMGYIFEELVRRFSESYNEDAGEHFTSRDIIYTMTDLLVCGENELDTTAKTVYDMAMGTSQMLGCMSERLKQLDSNMDVALFGQEINHETYAIAKADMMIKAGKADNMKQGNTLNDDKFSGYEFDYIISNPPFGRKWQDAKPHIEKESKLGDDGRFGMGLPKISDGQMLFTLNGIKKLKDTGKMAIIHNGSPLFTGDAGSGPSEIRRHIIENDWLDAIIQLPNDTFYNTGITTYIWIITKEKEDRRVGKIQLIDASKAFETRRKSIGNKRVDITQSCRDMIVTAYGEYMDKEYFEGDKAIESKIFDNQDFGYYKIAVETPTFDDDGNIILKKNKPVADTKKRDTENVPMKEDIEEYFKREVLPYNPNAWIDENKTKVGYEIPFTRHFYKYEAPEKADDIANRIKIIETDLMQSLSQLFDKEV